MGTLLKIRLLGALLAVACLLATADAGRAADLAALRERGTIRLLVSASDDEDLLPRAGWIPHEERLLAEEFAEELGLAPKWVYVEDFDELIPMLLAGQGDLVADLLTVTPERSKQVAFTAPLLVSRDQVVTRADDEKLTSPARLAGRSIAVRPGTPHWDRAEKLRKLHPRLLIEDVSDELGDDDILEGVALHRFDVTIADRDLVEGLLSYRDDLRVAFELRGEVPLAWAVRSDSPNLRRAADAFLLREKIDAPEAPAVGDLEEIRERGVLRVLTRNGSSTYHIWKGQLAGFEYELVRAFAQKLDLQLEIVVPPSREQLIPWLLAGRGDVVAAGLPAGRDPRVRYSRPHHQVQVQVIAPSAEPGPGAVEDLAGRRLAARRSGAEWDGVEELQRRGVAVESARAPEELGIEEIVALVAAGTYELALAASHEAVAPLAWRDDVGATLDLDDPVDLAWAVRPGNPELAGAIDGFLEGSAGLRATLVRRYFVSRPQMRARGQMPAAESGRLSRWDEPVQRFADRYRFDWRLITAQMAQESAFDPEARSPVGAYGLMQLMPPTAEQMAIENWEEPVPNIHAGVKYMDWVRRRFGPDLEPPERIWLSLASYNAGIGHVSDARKLAEDQGLDPDRWFGHTERGMLLKCQREFYRHTRFGYCRCQEPVSYVRRIRERYRAYLQSVGIEGAVEP
jgi:membrane-bound lytic murein transglycosylase F